MNKKEDYASDSDSSDEDFCPENEAAAISELSEESSNGEDDDFDDEQPKEDIEPNTKSKKTANRKRKSKNKTTKAAKANVRQSEQNEIESRRSTRQTSEAGTTKKIESEKAEIESDDDEKSRADALWADFLGDVKQTPVEVKQSEKITSQVNRTTATTNSHMDDGVNNKKSNGVETTKQVTITEIMDFAGEEVRVQKTVTAESIKENKETAAVATASSTTNGRGAIGSLKRNAAASGSSGSGLGSILNRIGKKQKISVLEKTKMDWNTFKQTEGIAEELQTFNKGKDGYLERQDFLERTDLRQFEIERGMRQSRRNQ